MKRTPITISSTAPMSVSRSWFSLQAIAEGGRREAEEDEDGRKRGDEQQAGPEHATPVGVLHLVDADAGHDREVAGHERQHAGGDERDRPAANATGTSAPLIGSIGRPAVPLRLSAAPPRGGDGAPERAGDRARAR